MSVTIYENIRARLVNEIVPDKEAIELCPTWEQERQRAEAIAARLRLRQRLVHESIPEKETAVLAALSGPYGRLLPPTLDDLADAYGGH